MFLQVDNGESLSVQSPGWKARWSLARHDTKCMVRNNPKTNKIAEKKHKYGGNRKKWCCFIFYSLTFDICWFFFWHFFWTLTKVRSKSPWKSMVGREHFHLGQETYFQGRLLIDSAGLIPWNNQATLKQHILWILYTLKILIDVCCRFQWWWFFPLNKPLGCPRELANG